MSDTHQSEGRAAMHHHSGSADLATLLAALGLLARTTSEPRPQPSGNDDPAAMLWRWLRPSWSRRLRPINDAMTNEPVETEWARGLDRLRRLHDAQAKIDLNRVHPTWWVRAIQEESPAVQRLVAATAPESIRAVIQNGLLLDRDDLRSDRPAVPEVSQWVQCLWTERLVGDEPENPDDSLAIMVLTRLSPRQGYRVCRMVGLIKLVVAAEANELQERRRVLERIEQIDTDFSERELRTEVLTRRDVQSVDSSDVARRHRSARLGVLTLARLLADCEPYRVRWALQHWPYPVAKLIRALIAREARGSSGLLQWESRILKSAWGRLNLEGTIPSFEATLPAACNER